jgi:2-hydroxy-6-oxonona-2,4-dienedioate hydrolase
MTLVVLASVLLTAAATAYAVARRLAPGDRPTPIRPAAVRGTHFPQRDIVVGGLRLRYVDVGDGPPLLLAHGHTSRIEEYDRLIRLLKGRFRVIVLDFPGSGYSDKPVRRYSVAFYVETLVAFLDALGVGKCLLAGGSLGGNVVLRASHAHPARFTRVAAWAPGSAWRARPALAWLMRRFGYLMFRVVVRVQSRYWYAPGWRGRAQALKNTFAYYREVLCDGFVRMYWDMAADQMGVSLFPIAPEIRASVLLLWGDRDHGFDMGAGVARLARTIPDVELVTFPDTGHAIANERPTGLARRLAEFFSAENENLP